MSVSTNQLQIVTIGIQGSGKSTTCFALEVLTGGHWLNQVFSSLAKFHIPQDEFFHLGKRAKSAFLCALSDKTSPSSVNPVIVDRINTLQSHRRDVFRAMRTTGIRVVIEWKVPQRQCFSRIIHRSYGHRSIKPDDNVNLILSRTVREFEPLNQEEIIEYGIRKVIKLENDGCIGREEVLRFVLDALSEFDPIINSISNTEISLAVQETMRRERHIGDINRPKIHKRSHAVDQSGIVAKEGRYEISLGNPGMFKELFESLNLDGLFICKEDFHVTLLFIKKRLARCINQELMSPQICIEGQSVPDSSADTFGTYSAEEYRAAMTIYTCIDSQEVELKLKYIGWNDRVVAVRVEFNDTEVPYFDVIPHISVAKVANAEFRESNSLVNEIDRMRNAGTMTDSTIHWIDLEKEASWCSGKVSFKLHGSK